MATGSGSAATTGSGSAAGTGSGSAAMTGSGSAGGDRLDLDDGLGLGTDDGLERDEGLQCRLRLGLSRDDGLGLGDGLGLRLGRGDDGLGLRLDDDGLRLGRDGDSGSAAATGSGSAWSNSAIASSRVCPGRMDVNMTDVRTAAAAATSLVGSDGSDATSGRSTGSGSISIRGAGLAATISGSSPEGRGPPAR